MVSPVVADHGRIDVLDNNIRMASVGGVTDLDSNEWDRVSRINLTGAFNAMRHVIPHMATAGSGSVVNISTVAGIRWSGVPHASYYASKAALNHLARTTAAEFTSRGVPSIIPASRPEPGNQLSEHLGESQGDTCTKTPLQIISPTPPLSRHGVLRPSPPLRRRQPLQLARGVRILKRRV